ncbi:hypothetical protein BV326_05863 [Pseudomonas syringae pv. actinidiae]|nr:hypothetical protein BV326_05863 [Pseudomonas syringae pv. actinidiae]
MNIQDEHKQQYVEAYSHIELAKTLGVSLALLVYRLKINFSHACVVIAARARCILFKISSPLAFQT